MNTTPHTHIWLINTTFTCYTCTHNSSIQALRNGFCVFEFIIVYHVKHNKYAVVVVVVFVVLVVVVCDTFTLKEWEKFIDSCLSHTLNCQQATTSKICLFIWIIYDLVVYLFIYFVISVSSFTLLLMLLPTEECYRCWCKATLFMILACNCWCWWLFIEYWRISSKEREKNQHRQIVL